MTEERIREAGRRLAAAWRAARPAGICPDALRTRSRGEAYAIRDATTAGRYVSTGAATDPRPVGPGSVVLARFGTLGAIDIVFAD